MPLPWSKSAPKSDRRQEWKALKAKHAKTVSPGSVEVGLGKALDAHQTQVTAILARDLGALNEEAFAPVVASSKAVKTLAVGLESKVKNNADYKAFLAELKQDAAWWEKAAQDFKKVGPAAAMPRNYDEMIAGVKTMQANALKADALLKTAGKKKGNYAPNEHTVAYLQASAKARPQLAKFGLLAKNPNGNYKLIAALLRAAETDLKALRLEALYVYNLKRYDFPADVDYAQLRTATNEIANGAHAFNRGIDELK